MNEDALELPPRPKAKRSFSITRRWVSRYAAIRWLCCARASRAILSAGQLHDLPSGRKVGACGIVTMRQQPQTANGTIFVTLEDETGPINVIVWKSIREEQRDALLKSRLLAVYGKWQRDVESGGQVRHLIAERMEDLTPLLGRLGSSRARAGIFIDLVSRSASISACQHGCRVRPA